MHPSIHSYMPVAYLTVACLSPTPRTAPSPSWDVYDARTRAAESCCGKCRKPRPGNGMGKHGKTY